MRPLTQPNSPSTESTWSPGLRRVATVWLCGHLFCTVLAPSAWPPPSSDLQRGLANLCLPYIKLFSLDNGYRFFAPDPGPSHLVRYELLDDQRTVLAAGKFPDRNRHRPRLMYHRHFMVAESINAQMTPFLDPPDEQRMTEQEKKDFQAGRTEALILVRGVARDLLRVNPRAHSVRLFLQRHGIPTPFDLDRGIQQDSPELYQEVPLGEFPREP